MKQKDTKGLKPPKTEPGSKTLQRILREGQDEPADRERIQTRWSAEY